MRQAAVFDSGLMIIFGEKMSQVGTGENLVSIPTEALRFMFKDMQSISEHGIITLKRYSCEGSTLEIGRGQHGYYVSWPNVFLLRIDKAEADDLRDLIFGKYSTALGFWWDSDVIAEESL